jgi:acetyltransferase-like isoleucine patch superfamily enzyme
MDTTVSEHKFRRTGNTRLLWLRNIVVSAKKTFYRHICGMDIDPTAEISLSAKFDMSYPGGVHVGAYSYIAFETRILCHDRTRGIRLHTRVGRDCFIGGRSLIMPGVEIGDNCVIGAGSVVTKSVPPRCIAAGNPAQILRENIEVGHYGRFAEADAREAGIAASGAA